jgi:hypothetical protein
MIGTVLSIAVLYGSGTVSVIGSTERTRTCAHVYVPLT